ncbi:hypothetical protein Tph_c10470 [Thermacetogenium phaeum DSM 12270]|uniref:Damage-control phosphatase ARMT1-like metal-binding domain-containing protein n=1 Tax=Thermacetogenium phaeum (strain ATCC BAA-254 / DSM 26808 / PB) TaxID=1089553 RepID=K4LTA9_THEPS|nr:ARMT1-like domain-containing protein [Thermacetogenium phaeum]AFV11269.1 hypothetical protein Tph_c10470 [Thermacetogenium phaeum DSM 12270]
MKLSVNCIPCLINQAVTQAKFHLDDEEQQFALVEKVMKELLSAERRCAPCVAQKIQRVLRESLQNPDPYKAQKTFYNKEMLKLEEAFQKAVAAVSADPLEQGLRLAVAGNIIDFGPYHDLSPEKVLKVVQETVKKDYKKRDAYKIKGKIKQGPETSLSGG